MRDVGEGDRAGCIGMGGMEMGMGEVEPLMMLLHAGEASEELGVDAVSLFPCPQLTFTLLIQEKIKVVE